MHDLTLFKLTGTWFVGADRAFFTRHSNYHILNTLPIKEVARFF